MQNKGIKLKEEIRSRQEEVGLRNKHNHISINESILSTKLKVFEWKSE